MTWRASFSRRYESALINRLTKSKTCASAPRPGVTRNLRWVRIGGLERQQGGLDLLDSPGVLPPRLSDQAAAARLAMANDIGEVSLSKYRLRLDPPQSSRRCLRRHPPQSNPRFFS